VKSSDQGSDRPLWLDDSPAPLAGRPAAQRADFAVIGAGLAGLSTAYHLLERWPGARVVVLEASRVGAGASGRTTGMLSPGVGQSIVALARRLGKDGARAAYQATLAAVAEVQALIARTDIACELAMTGQLVVARSPGGRRRLRAVAELMDELGLPFAALDEPATAGRIRLRPLPGSSRAADGPAALLYPQAGTLHPVQLLQGLLARVRAAGGLVYEGTRVLALEGTAGPGPARLRLADGSLVAEQVVVATAGYTPALGRLRGRVLPVHLQALATEPLSAEELLTIGWAGREGVMDARRLFSYLRLTADHRIVFGGGRPRYRYGGATDIDIDAGLDADAADALAALRRELANTFLPPFQARVARTWTGVIGYVVDALPTIGREPRSPRVLHLCGWCGHGVALATAAGRWAAALLAEERPEAAADSAAGLPWFRSRPPRVPTELARYVGFRASVATMAALDRLDR
jgi:gamma-glutamylputrescine oxidase